MKELSGARSAVTRRDDSQRQDEGFIARITFHLSPVGGSGPAMWAQTY